MAFKFNNKNKQNKPTSGKFIMKSWAFAALAAISTCCILASFFPNLMFSAIVVPNKIGSCLFVTKIHN
jgi:hypothetical protein